ncbi:YybH family protein [Silvibacterium sp.]|uniref:YybH family protein n=1 Tax=Silvibacterium sp. TaxID=1964179 RepID=UPI0039E6C8A0
MTSNPGRRLALPSSVVILLLSGALLVNAAVLFLQQKDRRAHAQVAAQAPAAILQVLKDQQEAWNRGDVVTFMRGYKDSPGTTFIGSSVQHGYQPILERYKKNYSTPEAMGHLDFSDFLVRMLGSDYAVVTGRFHLTRTAAGGGDAHGIFSLTFEHEPQKDDSGGWRIILDHTSTTP